MPILPAYENLLLDVFVGPAENGGVCKPETFRRGVSVSAPGLLLDKDGVLLLRWLIFFVFAEVLLLLLLLLFLMLFLLLFMFPPVLLAKDFLSVTVVALCPCGSATFLGAIGVLALGRVGTDSFAAGESVRLCASAASVSVTVSVEADELGSLTLSVAFSLAVFALLRPAKRLAVRPVSVLRVVVSVSVDEHDSDVSEETLLDDRFSAPFFCFDCFMGRVVGDECLLLIAGSVTRQSSHSPFLLAHFECRGLLQLGHGFKL